MIVGITNTTPHPFGIIMRTTYIDRDKNHTMLTNTKQIRVYTMKTLKFIPVYMVILLSLTLIDGHCSPQNHQRNKSVCSEKDDNFPSVIGETKIEETEEFDFDSMKPKSQIIPNTTTMRKTGFAIQRTVSVRGNYNVAESKQNKKKYDIEEEEEEEEAEDCDNAYNYTDFYGDDENIDYYPENEDDNNINIGKKGSGRIGSKGDNYLIGKKRMDKREKDAGKRLKNIKK